jgi:hypothetical protein
MRRLAWQRRRRGAVAECGAQPLRVPMTNPFYLSAEWRAFRAKILRERPFCEVRGCTRRPSHCDHRQTLRSGGAALDPANISVMCHSHHSAKTAQVDGGYGRPPRNTAPNLVATGCRADGTPLDSRHPWARK